MQLGPASRYLNRCGTFFTYTKHCFRIYIEYPEYLRESYIKRYLFTYHYLLIKLMNICCEGIVSIPIEMFLETILLNLVLTNEI